MTMLTPETSPSPSANQRIVQRLTRYPAMPHHLPFKSALQKPFRMLGLLSPWIALSPCTALQSAFLCFLHQRLSLLDLTVGQVNNSHFIAFHFIELFTNSRFGANLCWEMLESFFQHHLLALYLCVPFDNSCNISNFNYVKFVVVISDLWS